MPRPIRNLPVIQNWDCHACGNCCTDYVVPVASDERARILQQGWEQDPDFAGIPLFVRTTPWWQFWTKPKYRLNQRAGDRCVFLDEKGLCKIHAKFGLHAKPFACRLYPYILVPFGDHWRVSLRFACPSAAGNRGRTLTEQRAELAGYSAEMEAWDAERQREATPAAGEAAAAAQLARPPRFGPGQPLDWSEIQSLLDTLSVTLHDRQDHFVRRMLRCLALLRLVRHLNFTKLKTSQFRDVLRVMTIDVARGLPTDLQAWAKPGWIGRVLFRTTLAVYLRKDSGVRKGVAKAGRLALMAAMARMVAGRGLIPELQAGLPRLPFSAFEPSGAGWPDQVWEPLERYYHVKLESLQFCGPTCYNMSLFDGFCGLALTLPAILWLARGYVELKPVEQIQKAITVIDENFGYNPLLGQFRQRLSNRILAERQELERLIAHYGAG